MKVGFKILARAEIWIEISAPPVPLANSVMISTSTAHCQWEDETVMGGLATRLHMPWLRK